MGIALGQVAGEAISQGMGLLFANSQNSIQAHQQQRLTNMGLDAAEQLSSYNTGQQMNMWNATNYPAQVAQLQKAGLNPALLYAKGGMGGTTGSPTGGMPVGQAQVPQAAMGMNLASAQADIDLKKSQELLNQAQATKLSGPDTANVQASTELTQIQTGNAKIQGEIMNLQKTITAVGANVAQGTQQTQIDAAKTALQGLTATVQSEKAAGRISEDLANSTLQTAQIGVIQAALQTGATKAGIQKTQAETTEIAQNIIYLKQQGAYINEQGKLVIAQTATQGATKTNIEQNTKSQAISTEQGWMQQETNRTNANTQQKAVKVQQAMQEFETSGMKDYFRGLWNLIDLSPLSKAGPVTRNPIGFGR